MELTSTREASVAHGLKILVHGPAGAGKTRLLASTGDLEHTIILSAEAGLLSLREYDIDVAIIRTIDDLREAFMYVKRGLAPQQELVADDAEPMKRYRWVCLDSLSEIAEAVLSYEKSVNTNGQKAYGEMADTMFKLIRKFRDLAGINVVFTAKQERANDDGRLIYVPMLPGRQLTNNISYLFDEVFAMRTHRKDDGTIGRFLQTANDGTYDAKDRSGALDAAEPANLKHIAAKITSTTSNTNTTNTPTTTQEQRNG